MLLDKHAARALGERVLEMTTAKETIVRIEGGRAANTRFANNGITSGGDVDDLTVSVSVAFGKRHGSFTTNQVDDASLRAAVAAAEEMARLAPEDPEHMPPLGPQRIRDVAARDPRISGFGPAERQRGIGACLGPCLERKLVASGFFESSDRFEGIASSTGLFAHHAATDASFSATVRTADGTGSGWAQASSFKVGDVDWGDVGRRAVDKAERSARPRRLDPGRYTVILEPEAVAGLLSYVRFSLDARAADEGRSFFSRPGGGNRIGDKIFSENVTLLSDPHEPLLPSAPFDGSGLPLAPRAWVDKGILKDLVTTRFWAHKQGREPTGMPSNFVMRGGTTTLEQMIRSTEKGILVTRLWYVRFVDPQTLLLTGLTRDGTFWIEKGEIAYPVNNFRFNESPAALFARTEALSAPIRTSEGIVAPAVKASGFHMASISAAV